MIGLREPIKPDLVILHLSDLHFGPYLQGTSRIGEWSSFAPSHHYNLLQGMEAKIPAIRQRCKDGLITVVTGDMTTAAEPPAYMTVYNYLRNYPYVSSKHGVGLNLSAPNDRMYVVPGNHDVWLYGRAFTRWKKHANRMEEYKKYFDESLPEVYPIVINGESVTIYTLNSNKLTSFINPCNFTNVLGRGEVGIDQIGELLTRHTNLLSGIFPKKLPEDFDYSSSLKVVLMHHHLALPSQTPVNIEQRLLELKDTDLVLNTLCGLGVHIVLCGHQHFPYHLPELRSPQYPKHSIFLSCAGSASQIDCRQNSFYVYEIYNNHNGTYTLKATLYTANMRKHVYIFNAQRLSLFSLTDYRLSGRF